MQQQVLVVGAGPVGLTMAAELARYGVPVRIIDKSTERTDKSKALVMWSRTLELIDRMGCGASFVAAGRKMRGASIIAGSHQLAHISLDVPGNASPLRPDAAAERNRTSDGAAPERNRRPGRATGRTHPLHPWNGPRRRHLAPPRRPRRNHRRRLDDRLRRRPQQHPPRPRHAVRGRHPPQQLAPRRYPPGGKSDPVRRDRHLLARRRPVDDISHRPRAVSGHRRLRHRHLGRARRKIRRSKRSRPCSTSAVPAASRPRPRFGSAASQSMSAKSASTAPDASSSRATPPMSTAPPEGRA